MAVEIVHHFVAMQFNGIDLHTADCTDVNREHAFMNDVRQR